VALRPATWSSAHVRKAMSASSVSPALQATGETRRAEVHSLAAFHATVTSTPTPVMSSQVGVSASTTRPGPTVKSVRLVSMVTHWPVRLTTVSRVRVPIMVAVSNFSTETSLALTARRATQASDVTSVWTDTLVIQQASLVRVDPANAASVITTLIQMPLATVTERRVNVSSASTTRPGFTARSVCQITLEIHLLDSVKHVPAMRPVLLLCLADCVMNALDSVTVDLMSLGVSATSVQRVSGTLTAPLAVSGVFVTELER
jgi:hypothetical protein